MSEDIKYEYLLHTWGGFYNKEHKDKHGFEKGYHYFDSPKDRRAYLDELESTSQRLKAHVLCFTMEEGYHLRSEVVAHRFTKHKGRLYYSQCTFPPGYSYSTALYHIEDKWYVGFNDYPMGEDFDYENEEFEVVQEWITGAFSEDK